MKRTNKVAAMLLLTVGGSVTAQAQQFAYNPSWYIMPSLNAIEPDNRFADNNGAGIGLRFGKALNQHWDIQFGPTYSRNNGSSPSYRDETLGVDGLYLFSRDRFRPFLLIGGGAEYDRVQAPVNNESGTSPYVNAGLGFQYEFSDQWGMQADLRRSHAWVHNEDFGFDRANNSTLTIGVTYAFNRTPQHVVDAPIAAAPPPAVAPMPAPAPPPPPPPRFERYTLSSTELFTFDSSDLRMPQPKLDEIVAALKRDMTVNNVVITGYTDRIGSDAYNLKLSQRRADSVKTYLVSQGIDASRLSTVGKGKADPVVQCTDKSRPALIKCLEPNRRVEIEQITVQRRVS